jgi:hypothetical protein
MDLDARLERVTACDNGVASRDNGVASRDESATLKNGARKNSQV